MPDSKPHAPDHDDHQSDPAADHSVTDPAKTTVSPVIAMTFVIVILLTILIVMRFKNPSGNQDQVAVLQAEIDKLTLHGGSLGAPTLGGGEQLQDIASRMKKDADSMVLLADRYKQLLDESKAELAKRSTDLLNSEGYRQSMTNDLVRLKNELQEAKSGSYEAESLRREVAALKAQRDAQTAELLALKQQLAKAGEMASKDDLADLQRRFDETLRAKDFFESRAKELESELAKSKDRLFARSDNELLPAAVELIRTLRKLENQPAAEIAKAYGGIGTDLGAAVVKTMTFPTGSAKMDPADEEPVRQLLAATPDGDMLLVVGYASETGNVDGNRTLSSDRATGVAELLTAGKRPGQQVQAFYLGQTDRFGKVAENNQCCEVWHIQAKHAAPAR